MNIQEIIRTAFAETTTPTGEIFCTADAEGAEDVFPNRHWSQLDTQELKYHSACINFLNNEGFSHYLPAFMFAAFEDNGIKDSLILKLYPPKNDLSRPSFAAWWSLLSDQQKLAVINFIEHFETQENIFPSATLIALQTDVKTSPSFKRDA